MTAGGLLAAGGLLLAVIVALDRLAGRVTRPRLKPIERDVASSGLPFEELAIDSDGQGLAAWFVPGSESDGRAPLLVMVHGWTANAGTVLALGDPLARAGHDVLLFDVRGHGHSTSEEAVHVRHFRDDLAAVLRYAERRFPGRRKVVVGHSMGGAGAVLAAADGAPIDGLVLIATPADVIKVTAEYLDDHGWPGDLLMTVLRPFLWRRVGSTFRPLTPALRIRELSIPILLIQPEDDARVVRDHARRLAEATGLPLHIIEDREHTDVLDARLTRALVESFLDEFPPRSEG